MISIILSTLSVSAQTTSPFMSPADGLPIACLFPEVGFAGSKSCFTETNGLSIELGADIFDKAYSMIVKPGCTVLGATDTNGVGSVRKFSGMVSDLDNFNGAISSIQIRCGADIDMPRNLLCTFSEAGFRGESSCYNSEVEIRMPEEAQEKISSVYLRPGCTLSLFKTYDFTGDALVIPTLVTELNRGYEDQIKSFSVSCSSEKILS